MHNLIIVWRIFGYSNIFEYFPIRIFVRIIFLIRIYSYIRSYAFFGYEYIRIFVHIIFFIRIYSDIRSYCFFDMNIFGSFVLFFSVQIFSDIHLYQNFIFVTLCFKTRIFLKLNPCKTVNTLAVMLQGKFRKLSKCIPILSL